MTSRDFVNWLNGFIELENPETINKQQVEVIKNHLKLVFFYEIDPSYTSDSNKQQQMQDIHDGKKEEPKKPLWATGERC